MSISDFFIYILDAVIIILFSKMLMNSREVVVEVKVKAKWLIVLIFSILAILGWFRYEGTFRYFQTILIIVIAGLYYNMKSGLSPKGIVTMGSLTTYEKSGTVTLSRENNCVIYKQKGMDAALFFDPDQYDEVREYLKKQSILSSQ